MTTNTQFTVWDYTYCDLVLRCLAGDKKQDRTGVGTRSIYGAAFSVPLTPFPLLQVKKVNYDWVLRELFMFLTGGRNLNDLGPARALWEPWVKEGGDLGPIYGVQWRDWDAGDDNYKVDQLEALHLGLELSPHSRRMVVSAWRPDMLDYMALPPCHYAWQVTVTSDNCLNLHVTMRSGDLGLGIPFNVASYATIAYMLCKVHGFTPGKLYFSVGDLHVYENHVGPLEGRVEEVVGAKRGTAAFEPSRTRFLVSVFGVSAREGPALELVNPDPDRFRLDMGYRVALYDVSWFQVDNYNPLPYLKLEVAV